MDGCHARSVNGTKSYSELRLQPGRRIFRSTAGTANMRLSWISKARALNAGANDIARDRVLLVPAFLFLAMEVIARGKQAASALSASRLLSAGRRRILRSAQAQEGRVPQRRRQAVAQAVQAGYLEGLPSAHATGQGTVLPELQRGRASGQGRRS